MEDRIISVIFMLLGGILYYLSLSYPPESTAYVKFILFIFVLLSIVMFIWPQKYKNYSLKHLFTKQKIITIILLILYAVLIPIAGFFITTFIFSVVFMWIFDNKGLPRYTLITAIFCLLIYFVFQKLLYIWFPTGLLI